LVYRGIKFVYDEPAMVVNADNEEYLVIGDLHIGMELELSKKGVHLFSATENMGKRIIKIMNDFSLTKMIMLGDIKNSILYPEFSEIRLLKEFFDALSKFEIKIVAGNHDAHLAELIDHEVVKELVVGNFGFLHGNRKPDQSIMMLDYIISAHDHLAVRIKEKNGAIYEQKAWGIYSINKRMAKSSYDKFNEKIKLVSMPAFNDLIIGTTIEKLSASRMNPLLNSKIFSKNAEIYNTLGQRVSLRR
jgi:uncharacterized protein